MMLELRNLRFGYGAREVGRDVTLSVSEGEVLALLGPNGAGKTTLFKTMLGLLAPKKGGVWLDGVPITGLSRAQRAQKIAYVPQAHAALFPFTVRDIVLMGRAARLASFATPSKRDREIAMQALDRLGMTHLAARSYTEISGGERQMALIARALAQQPEILVMDEPTASLDYGNQMRVLSHIGRLANEGIAVILSTHNPDHVFMVADRVAFLHEGHLAAIGPPETVLTVERLKQLYDIDVVIGTIPGSTTLVCAPRHDFKGGH
jgi:iron complex transport system ATP-binding protein